METITVRTESQASLVQSEVLAMISVIRPILLGMLYSTKAGIIEEAGGFQNVKLKMLPFLHNPGDGDIGICFEWAIHDAIKRNDALILDRIETSLKHCKVKGQSITSILFGAEKSGVLQLIDTAQQILTDDSRLLTGAQAQPVKLKRHLNSIVGAFTNARTRPALPYSISGLWKADLFLGRTDTDRWIGSTVKINAQDLEAAKGLRVGIVPLSQGKSDKVHFDYARNIVVCPVPYDQSFMQVFYNGWRVVQQFVAAKGKMPKEAALPNPAERQVARELVDRLEFPVLEVVEVLEAQSQQGLLASATSSAALALNKPAVLSKTDTIISPVPFLSS